jgi:beta-phosphoglucomutase
MFTEAQGRPMSHEFFDETFGFWNDTILRRHFGPRLSAAEIARLSDDKESLYRSLLLEGGAEPLPGVRTWLEDFRRQGWRQALGSMAPRDNIAVTLRALGIRDYFDAVVSGQDVRHGKPDPEVFLTAAERLGAQPARCVVLEDSLQGVQAARAAGMRCIAVGPVSATLGADLALPSLAAAGAAVAAELLR